jgi:hypothetical protein
MTQEETIGKGASDEPTTTLVYKKYFAALGVICGLALFFGTPPLVLQFHEGFQSSYGQKWVESFPHWVASSMLLLGMGGGVVTILASCLFGVLIPSQVIRHDKCQVPPHSSPDA